MPKIIIHAKSASVIATLEGVVVELEGATSGEPILPTTSESSSSTGYDKVASYAQHRGQSEKTIRKYLPLLPHGRAGGIRIKRREADEVMDALSPIRRRKPRGRKNNNHTNVG